MKNLLLQIQSNCPDSPALKAVLLGSQAGISVLIWMNDCQVLASGLLIYEEDVSAYVHLQKGFILSLNNHSQAPYICCKRKDHSSVGVTSCWLSHYKYRKNAKPTCQNYCHQSSPPSTVLAAIKQALLCVCVCVFLCRDEENSHKTRTESLC